MSVAVAVALPAGAAVFEITMLFVEPALPPVVHDMDPAAVYPVGNDCTNTLLIAANIPVAVPVTATPLVVFARFAP